ncbi:MAG: NAD(P)-dependent oxidoreductase [Hyphomicrobiales bacterium]|nr:NAD(P)-dependent oxidoreductase [Hyphomicrobiales bacterium]
MAKIAFLGTGSMGAAMIKNYLKGGHEVTVCNRTIAKAEPLKALGAKVAITPKEAVEDAEVVISCLTNDDASRDSWNGENGALKGNFKPGAFAIEASTASLEWIRELDGLAQAKGMHFLDCPVAGRPDLANAGKLKVFAGGSADDVDAMRPVLDAISAAVIHFGPVGSGITFKLIYNVMGALQVAATAEGLIACEAAGIDLRVAADAFSNGATGSPHVKLHSKNMAEGIINDPIMFTGKNRIKDTRYGIEVIDSLGAQSILGRGTIQVWEQMVEQGMELRNDSELIDALRAAAKTG